MVKMVEKVKMFKKLAGWARKKSPWILLFNSGSCNACDIEVIAAVTPRFDVERFGVLVKGSPRHADVLVVTGPVTRQQAERLRRIYDQMPDPKYVVAMGSCASTGGVFKGLYNVMEGVDKVIPVDAYVAGCPPRPDEIIDAVVAVLGMVESGDGRARAKSKDPLKAPAEVS
jgi:NADH-quinone oxidoreductase B subunit